MHDGPLAGAVGAGTTTKNESSSPTLLELARAMEQELSQLWCAHHQLAEKASRFERVFEQLFQEEAAKRIGGGGQKLAYQALDGGARISEFARIRMTLERVAEQEAKERAYQNLNPRNETIHERNLREGTSGLRS